MGAKLSIVNAPQRIKKIEWKNGGTVVHTWTRDLQIVAGTGAPSLSLTTLPGPFGLLLEANGALSVGEYAPARVIQFPPGSVGGTPGTVIAGGNGGGTDLNQLSTFDLARDAAGNLYVPDANNYRVLKFPPGSNNTTMGIVVAGNGTPGQQLDQLMSPAGVVVDAGGNLYVSERFGHRVLRFPRGSTSTTMGTLVAGGNGAGNGLNQLNTPYSIRLTASGDLLIADAGNHRIMRWTPGAPAGTVVAGGNGAGNAADQLNQPRYCYEDAAQNLYISDQQNHRIQKWAPGAITGITVAGGYGNGADPWQLPTPMGIAFDPDSNLYVNSFNGHSVRKLAPAFYLATAPGTYSALVTLEDDTQIATNNITLNNPTSFGVSIHASANAFTPGAPLSFTALPVNATTPAYQWKVNGLTLASANGPTFTSSTLQEGDIVTCEMTAPSPCTFQPATCLSNSITLHEIKKPLLTASGTCTGATLRINAAYPLTKIAWYRNGVLVNTADTTRTIRTFAGGNGSGASLTQLFNPSDVYRHTDGYIYVTDQANNRILKYPANATGATPGIIVAGGNGLGNALNQFSGAIAITFDTGGNLYVLDMLNSRVLKFPPHSDGTTMGAVVAGGNGNGTAQHQFRTASDIAVDAAGNLYVADQENRRILRFPPGSTAATYGTIVAGGNGTGVELNKIHPAALLVDDWGNLYVSDASNNRLLKFTPGNEYGTLVAGGNGNGSAPNQLSQGWGLARDVTGNLYISENNNQRVGLWKPGTTSGQYWAGGNGMGGDPQQFNTPWGLSIDSLGNTWIADRINNRIQYYSLDLNRAFTPGQPGTWKAVVTALDGTVTTTADVVLHDSSMPRVTIYTPYTTVQKGTNLTFTAAVHNGGPTPQLQWKVNGNNIAMGPTFSTGTLRNGDRVTCELTHHTPCVAPGTVLSNAIVLTIGDAPTLAGTTSCPGSILTVSSQLAIQKIDWYKDNVLVNTMQASWTGRTAAGGNGAGAALNQLNAPFGLAIDHAGNRYVSEWGGHRILKFPPGSTGATNGMVVAGGNGPGAALHQLDHPAGISLDGHGYLYVSDHNNQRILRFPPNGTAATPGEIIAGGNGPGNSLRQFRFPAGLWLDSLGYLYVADRDNHRILRFPPGSNQFTDGVVVAGGTGPGLGTNQLNLPNNVAMDAQGNLLITEIFNHRVIRWTPGAPNGTVAAGNNGVGANLNQTTYPNSVIADLSGNLYVIARSNNRLVRWAPGATEGTLIAGGPSAGAGNNEFDQPATVSRDAAGNFLVTDMNNHRLQLLTPSLTPSYTTPGPGTYKAIVTTIDGTTTTTAELIIEAALTPTVTIAASSTSICAGKPVTFTATPGNAGTSPTFQWKLNGNAVTGTGNTYTNGSLQAGDVVTCVLTPAADAGCLTANTATGNNVTISILAAPAMQPITGNTTLCAQSTAQLANATPHATGSWKSLHAAVATVDGAGKITAIAAGTAIIRFIATAASGCIDSTETTITVQPLQTPGITVQASATVACAGSPITFSAGSSNAGTPPAYRWQVNGLPNGFTGASFTSNTLQQGDVVTCVLTPAANAGCLTAPSVTSTPITLTIDALPVMAPITGQPTLCTQGTTLLANATAAATGLWKSLQPSIVTVATDGLVTGHIPGTATIRYIATNTAGCRDSTERSVTVQPSVTPTITITASYSDTCRGAPISFSAMGTEEGTQPHYQWLVNGAGAGSGPQWTTTHLKNGDQVTATLTSNAGCATTNSVTALPLTPLIYPLPVVDAGPDKTILKGDVVILEGKVQGAANISWTPRAGLQQTTLPTPLASPANTTTYTLEATTVHGCLARDEVIIAVIPPIKMPNAFSPNGDGIHDTWELPDLRHFPQAAIQVFNRNGQQVYSVRGYQPGRGWNGTFKGYILPAGTYYYVIDLKNGRPKISGSVTLIK